MKTADRNALITLVCAILVLALFMFMPAINWPASSTKWQHDMPEDGTMLCSQAGEGFRVNNNPWGFRVDRFPTFDESCRKFIK
jgi:hypothetical protein